MSAFVRLSDSWLQWAVATSWQLALLVGLVAMACLLLRKASPRLRHALWLLVVLKCFLPPTFATSWSVGRWGVQPLWQSAHESLTRPLTSTGPPAVDATHSTSGLSGDDAGPSAGTVDVRRAIPLIGWAVGCLGLWSLVTWRSIRLDRVLKAAQCLDEGPARVALERTAMELGDRRAPELYAVDSDTSPFLFGLLRPRIVLPQSLIDNLDGEQLRAVLAHELIHCQRHDLWIGWWQVFAQGLFWFHPLVWWANARLRHERECVCDESVLRLGRFSPQQYGETIVRVLTDARGRAVVAGTLVGVFERGSQLQNRVEDIMNYEPKRQTFGWVSRAAVVAFALLFLPMAPSAADRSNADETTTDAPKETAAPKTSYPQIVKTMPEVAATGVDASLDAITVTFDRDMQGGMSWTGGPPLFPPIDKSRKVQWTDKRTCVLPVKLAKGKFYRVGINSTSFNNFKSTGGVSAPPSAVYFATEGATKGVESHVKAPKIVELEPENGASDVDPSITTLRVTFDRPMGEGMSWTGGGETFPVIPKGQQSRWSRDGRTCTLPVKLQPGKSYSLGLNSLSHINFQSKWGVPLEPVAYKFSTTSR